MSGPTHDSLPRRAFLAILVAGLGLRLLLLLVAGPVELQSDEANYVHLALSWNYFGVYFDCFRFLWPPGYAWVLARGFAWFGDGALLAVKLLQILASASIGATVMLFAARLFGRRAALVAGIGWVVYLPLVAFTHLLWNETLFLATFLPSLYLILTVLETPGDGRVDRRILGAGVLFAVSLYMKEAPIYLVPALGLLLAFRPGDRTEGVRRGGLFLLAIAACVLPWTLRNQEVYGRWVPLGTSLGENAYNGLNGWYRNFDLIPLEKRREAEGLPSWSEVLRQRFVDPAAPEAWERATDVWNTVDRLDENKERGLRWMAANPGDFAASRVKKLADLVTPHSFFTRHVALGNYDAGPIGGGLRKPLVLWALLCPLLLLPLGAWGLFTTLERGHARRLFGLVFLYFGATTLLVSMSRFRLPLVPILLVLAAGFVVHRVRSRALLGLVGAGTACAWLVFAWWLDFPEIREVFAMAWRGTR